VLVEQGTTFNEREYSQLCGGEEANAGHLLSEG
jgi:hypothetical protein